MAKLQSSYCAELVQEHDPDRYLCTMFVPPEKREALCALFAFNYEIAKTREVVSDTTLGLIRLQWWKDALKGHYEAGDILEHQVLKPLVDAIKTHDLPREEFENLLYAREFDLEDAVPEGMDGLIKYAEVTTVPLNRLALQILGEESENIEDISIACALTGLLRAMPYHEAQNRRYIPQNVEINEVIETAREILAKEAGNSRFLKIQRVMSALYLKHLTKYKSDIKHPKALLQPPFFTLRLTLSMFR